MTNHIIQAEIQAGSQIRTGVPADQPEKAITALKAHFRDRLAVTAAYLGLMEVIPPSGSSYFTYTIGLCCEHNDQSAEQEAALRLLTNFPLGRWPISIFPYTNEHFTKEAICFYDLKSVAAKRSFFARFFQSR